MCYFITIAVPQDAARAVIARHDARHMRVTLTKNPAALAAAEAGWTPLLVTGGGCSCGWYKRPASAGAEDARLRARRKYARLGWSQAKIERALGSVDRPANPDDGLHPVIIGLLRAIATEHGRARIWVHDFTGKVETEAYRITAQQRWPLAQLAERAAALDVDTVATLVATSEGSPRRSTAPIRKVL